jgi:hypothetical protein
MTATAIDVAAAAAAVISSQKWWLLPLHKLRAAVYAELGASPAGGSLALLSLLLLSAAGCLKLRSASSSPVLTR